MSTDVPENIGRLQREIDSFSIKDDGKMARRVDNDDVITTLTDKSQKTQIVAEDGTPIGNIQDAFKVDFPEYRVDSFGLQKVSNPITVFEGAHKFGKDDLNWAEKIVGGATSTHDANKVSVHMQTGTAAGDKVIRRTYRHMPYFKGKSQIWLGTGNLKGGQAGVRKRYGLYTDNNGVFFEFNGTDFRVVRRSKISGSVDDDPIDRTLWNLDKLNGSGLSKRNVDFDGQIVYYTDFSWLGSGDIFFGVLFDRKINFCHKINVSTFLDEPWSQSGTLPIAAEIENLTAQATGAEMFVTCNTVISSGGKVDFGVVKILDTETAEVTVGVTDQVIAGIRLKPTVENCSARPLSFEIQPTSGQSTIYWQVLFRPDLVGDTWTPFDEISETLTNNPAFTGGHKIASGHISLAKGDTAAQNIPVESDTFLGWDVDKNPDALILVVRTTSGTGTILFSGAFREYL